MVKNKRIKIDSPILSILISPLKRKKDDAMRARSFVIFSKFTFHIYQFHVINALGGVFEGI